MREFLLDSNFYSFLPSIELALPIGISFYTFQTISYTVDVYRGHIKAEKSFLKMFLYVSFFPQLVAGPIERASRLLPQFDQISLASKDQIKEGLFLIFFGLAKKLILADRLGFYGNEVYSNFIEASSFDLLLASYMIALQFYFDFSAYSEIARGCAKCLGFNLMVNFKAPLWTISPTKFWSRWHISFMSWLSDYIFYPLISWMNLNRLSIFASTLIVFFLSGVWHGGDLKFLVWGVLIGFVVGVDHFFLKKMKRVKNPIKGALWFLNFNHFAVLGVFVFAYSYEQAIDILIKILTFNNWKLALVAELITFTEVLVILVFMLFFNIIDWKKLTLSFNQKIIQMENYWPLIGSLLYTILLFGFRLGEKREFLYFQF